MRETTDVRLLPCPHCGWEAEIVSGSPGCHFVQCKGCRATSDDRALDKAIELWNRRAALEPAPKPAGGEWISGGEVTLAECPIGLFMAGDELCLKTEYGNNEGRIDAYIVSSGEFFWGSTPQTIANQRAQRVRPVAAPVPPSTDGAVDVGELVEALQMISGEAKESNEPIGRSVYKALATCGELADLALAAYKRSTTDGQS